jgi:hypothetical protein
MPRLSSQTPVRFWPGPHPESCPGLWPEPDARSAPALWPARPALPPAEPASQPANARALARPSRLALERALAPPPLPALERPQGGESRLAALPCMLYSVPCIPVGHPAALTIGLVRRALPPARPVKAPSVSPQTIRPCHLNAVKRLLRPSGTGSVCGLAGSAASAPEILRYAQNDSVRPPSRPPVRFDTGLASGYN